MEINYFLPAHLRAREYEADKFGIELMRKAGYKPRGSLVALKRDSSYFTGQKNGPNATHPSILERLESNRKTIEEVKIR